MDQTLSGLPRAIKIDTRGMEFDIQIFSLQNLFFILWIEKYSTSDHWLHWEEKLLFVVHLLVNYIRMFVVLSISLIRLDMKLILLCLSFEK